MRFATFVYVMFVFGLTLGASQIVIASEDAMSESYVDRTLASEGVRIGPQPTERELKELKQQGVKLVISNRSAEEMSQLGFDEAAVLESLGIAYVHIPMRGVPGGLTQENRDALAQALADTDPESVLMHCRSGYRSASLLASLLMEQEGISAEQAVQRVGDPRVTPEKIAQ